MNPPKFGAFSYRVSSAGIAVTAIASFVSLQHTRVGSLAL